MPDPLHPAIVHFPIVLILVGALLALIAVFWPRHQLPLLAAVFLTCGVLGCWMAMESGESDGDAFGHAAPRFELLLDEHEDWAERTLGITAAAAVIAIASVALVRFPKVSRVIAVLAALVSLAASYAVYQTGHHGGALVYSDNGAAIAENNRATGGHQLAVDPD